LHFSARFKSNPLKFSFSNPSIVRRFQRFRQQAIFRSSTRPSIPPPSVYVSRRVCTAKQQSSFHRSRFFPKNAPHQLSAHPLNHPFRSLRVIGA